MKELKCPKCGNVFSVDEADYAFIVSQVRTSEFNAELKRRLEELHRQHQTEQAVEEAKLASKHQAELNRKDQDINQKDLVITQLKKDLQAAEEQKKSAVNVALAEKDKLIAELRSQIAQNTSRQQVAIMETQQKAQAQLNQKDLEITKLKSSVEAQRLEITNKLASQKEQYENELKSKQELVEYYKDQKRLASVEIVAAETVSPQKYRHTLYKIFQKYINVK